MSTRAASQSSQPFWRWLCGTVVVLTSLSSPIFAADRAPASLADDWLVALQAGRDARHFPRDLSSHAVATLPAGTTMGLEDSLLRALDRGEHVQFVLTWRRLEAAHLLAEARLQDIGQQLQSKAVSDSILQRHTEAVDSARERHGTSVRRACRVLGVNRSSYRYRRRRPNDAALRQRGLTPLEFHEKNFGQDPRGGGVALAA